MLQLLLALLLTPLVVRVSSAADSPNILWITAEDTLIQDRDLGLWPEPERTAAEQGATAWDRAREPEKYPLNRILEVARLVGVGKDNRALFEKSLANPDAAVRYWAVIGPDVLSLEGESVFPQLASMLRDEAASVRIAAAETPARHGKPVLAAQALDVLADELSNRHEWTACRAARALELLGRRARSKLSMLQEALRRRSAGFFGQRGPDPVHYGLEFSLRTALQTLESP